MSKSKHILILIVILTITGLAFLPSLNNGFTNWDDNTHLYENRFVRSLDFENVVNIFKDTVNHTYIPLTTLSFAVEYQLFKLNPFNYHLNNLILHLGVVALIYIFALCCGLKWIGASVASLIFAVHPMHVESVAWVTERKDLLYSFFYLLALINYWLYLEKQDRGNYILSLVFGLLSILAKPMALSLPLILFVLDYLKGRKINLAAIKDKVLHFLYIVPIASITYFLNARVPEARLSEAVPTWIASFSFYLHKFIFPLQLSPLYQFPKPVSFIQPFYLMSLVIALSFIVLVFMFKRNRWFIFACSFYFLSVFFLLRFDDLKDYSIVADRFMYLPSLGFCLLLGVVMQNIAGKSKQVKMIGTTVFVALIALYSVKTFNQCKVWANSETLWSEVIKQDETIVRAYNNRATLYNDQGRYDLALKDTQKAVELDPENYDALSSRGLAFMMQGKMGIAKTDLDRAIALNPEQVMAYNSRGFLYLSQGKLDLALADFNKALTLNINKPEIYVNRGTVYVRQANLPLALKDFNTALAIDPLHEEAYSNRGLIYFQSQQLSLALKDFNKAISINPTRPELYLNRGSVYFREEKYGQALKDFNQALKLNPNASGALLNRSMVYILLGEKEKALNDALKAQSLGHRVDARYIEQIKQLEP